MNPETALEIIREDYDESAYTVIEDNVDDGHVKHDSTAYYTIVQRQSDKTFWMISFTASYNYGLDEDSISTSEVERKEITTYKWVSK